MKIWARLGSWVLPRWLLFGTLVGLSLIIVIGSGWAIATSQKLSAASQSPLDAYLMLGGSIRREVHMTQVAKDDPNIPILISQGADDPCIIRLFEVNTAPQNQVWLERCAHSTFENFYYTLPILKQWGVHHVQTITSARHLPRAQWLGTIILGSHGIWMETYTVKEQGIPGNTESSLKTGLDVIRSLIWAGISQFYQPSCRQFYRLVDSNLQEWIEKGYGCEDQWDLRHIFKEMP